MAELRKRDIGSSLQHSGESSGISLSFTKSKQISSRGWIFVVILLFYLCSVYIGYRASRIVPAPKTSSGSSTNEFVEEAAREHLDAIVSFGPRPTGSYANEIQAVNYIIETLRAIKLSAREDVVIEIEVQRPSGTFTLDFIGGFTSVYRNVTNILVRLAPKENYPPKDTVLISGHFDSIPGGPGASDDAVSCAVMFEVLRCLVQSRRFRFTHGVVFNFNGAEENVLQASHGFITQHDWAKTIRAFVNLEAAGAGGRELVFQAGPDHPWLIKTYAEVAPYPYAQALGQEVFQSGLIPSDTDFRIYRDFGNIPGIDIAYAANGYVYHTKYDTPAAVTPGSIQRAGDNILTLVKTILNSPFLSDPGEYRHGAMVFFDFIGLFLIHYPERIGFVVNIVAAVGVVLCLFSKFSGFPAKKKNQECGHPTTSSSSSLLSSSSSIGGVLTSLLILLLSWLVGLALPQGLALLLTYTERSLTWYCRPHLLLGLYIAPTVFGIGLVHFLARQSLVTEIKALKKNDTSSDFVHDCRTANLLAVRESQMFYASLVVWTVILLIMTYYRLTSAHLPLLWVLFPLVFRALIWENLSKTRTSHQSLGLFLFVYLSSNVVPLLFSSYVTVVVLDIFVPTAGRGGTQVPPDHFIAMMCTCCVVMLTSYVVGLVYVMDNLKVPAAILLGASVLSVLTSLSGLSFPYSAINQCPKRVFFQHISRAFYDDKGVVITEDSGVWITPLDYLGIQPFSHIAEFKQAKLAPQEGVYGGFPYYLPLRHLIRKSWYLPAASPNVKKSPLNVKLLSREQDVRTFIFKFSISGPDHMTVYLSPGSSVDLVWSSLGLLYPVEIHDSQGRLTYFIYYSHGADVGPWELSLVLVTREDLPSKTKLMDFAVAAHYLHGEESSSAVLDELFKVTPEWTFSNCWVNIYKSWSYST